MRDSHQMALARLRERFIKRLVDAFTAGTATRTTPPWAGPRAEEMAERYVQRVDTFVRTLVQKDSIRAAVLDRAELAETWDLYDHGHEDGGKSEGISSILVALLNIHDPHREHRNIWPGNVTVDEVAELLEKCGDSDAARVASELRSGGIEVHDTIRTVDRLLVRPVSAVQKGAPSRLTHRLAGMTDEEIDSYAESIREAIEQNAEWLGQQFNSFRAIAHGRMTIDGRAVNPALDRALQRWPVLRCARVASVVKDVEEESARRFIALSARAESRAAVNLISQGPKGPWKNGTSRKDSEARFIGFEVLWDGRPREYQLSLEFGPTLDDAVVMGILSELQDDGLRDWLILHRLAAEQGRTDRLRWTWAWHRERSAYDRRIKSRNITDAEAARDVTRRLWQLKKTEIRSLHRLPDGRTAFMRIGPHGLIDMSAGIQEDDGSLDGAILAINPVLYHGAHREGEKHYVLLPDDALMLEGRQLRLATMLALAMRDEVDHGCRIVRTARVMWEYLHLENGKPQRRHWPRAIERAGRALDELAGRKVISGWSVESGAASPDLRFTIEPPQAMRDQLIHKVPPRLPASRAAVPITGAALRAWREARGLTQAAAAAALEVGIATIKRAEKAADEPLGPAVRAAFNRVVDAPRLPPPGRSGEGQG